MASTPNKAASSKEGPWGKNYNSKKKKTDGKERKTFHKGRKLEKVAQLIGQVGLLTRDACGRDYPPIRGKRDPHS